MIITISFYFTSAQNWMVLVRMMVNCEVSIVSNILLHYILSEDVLCGPVCSVQVKRHAQC